jgi:hydrogenase nickel incorporation protein HypA/HybF
MHELSIANEILKIVQEHATAEGIEALSVTAVGIRLGAWSCVQEQSLRNSFRWVTSETPFASVRLDIDRIDEVWVCQSCQQSFDQNKQTTHGALNCPWCGDPLGLLDGVQEMRVEWIEIQDHQGA